MCCVCVCERRRQREAATLSSKVAGNILKLVFLVLYWKHYKTGVFSFILTLKTEAACGNSWSMFCSEVCSRQKINRQAVPSGVD